MCRHNVHTLTCESCGVEFETFVRVKPCQKELTLRPNPHLYDVWDGFRTVENRKKAMEEKESADACSDLVIDEYGWDGMCKTCRTHPRRDLQR